MSRPTNGALFLVHAQRHRIFRWIQTSPAFRAGRPRARFELHTANWDVAPDGKRLLVVKEPEAAAGEAKLQAVVNWFEELRQKAPAGRK